MRFDIVFGGGSVESHREQSAAFDAAKAWSLRRANTGVAIYKMTGNGRRCLGVYLDGEWETAPANTEWRE